MQMMLRNTAFAASEAVTTLPSARYARSHLPFEGRQGELAIGQEKSLHDVTPLRLDKLGTSPRGEALFIISSLK